MNILITLLLLSINSKLSSHKMLLKIKDKEEASGSRWWSKDGVLISCEGT